MNEIVQLHSILYSPRSFKICCFWYCRIYILSLQNASGVFPETSSTWRQTGRGCGRETFNNLAKWIAFIVRDRMSSAPDGLVGSKNSYQSYYILYVCIENAFHGSCLVSLRDSSSSFWWIDLQKDPGIINFHPDCVLFTKLTCLSSTVLPHVCDDLFHVIQIYWKVVNHYLFRNVWIWMECILLLCKECVLLSMRLHNIQSLQIKLANDSETPPSERVLHVEDAPSFIYTAEC